MELAKGPLGSHLGYITHIALENYLDYCDLRRSNREKGSDSNTARHKEFRYLLNAAESFNNILDYFYFEQEDKIRHKTVGQFREGVHAKFPELGAVADIANAYKHCVRVSRGGEKNNSVPWAKDLQNPVIDVYVNVRTEDVSLRYQFLWPDVELETAVEKAFQFWQRYLQSPFASEIVRA